MEKKPSFEDAIKELDTIIGKLENDKVSLADSLKLYKDGVKLVNDCSTMLDKIEKQVKILEPKEKFEDE